MVCGDAMLTLERLKEVLFYNPETGIFIWKKSTDKIKPGKVAGTLTKGYVAIRIDGTRYFAHRLAWFYIYGQFPSMDIDHINCIKNDNRILNLRNVNAVINAQNVIKARPCNKSTGLLGAYAFKDYFVAMIRYNGKNVNLGYFKTAELAHNAYVEAKRKYHEGNTL